MQYTKDVLVSWQFIVLVCLVVLTIDYIIIKEFIGILYLM